MIDILSLTRMAIKLALAGKWQEAEKVNRQIIEEEPKNIPALLRQARVYTNLNKISRSKKIYRLVLTLDRYNPIAKRNMARLEKIKNGSLYKDSTITNPLFLEEPGKTKSVNLVRLTCEKNLAPLEIGEPVCFSIGGRSISVCSKTGKYLGRLPDDLAFRLIQLTKTGNHYETFIRLIEENRVQIFIRETKKGKRNLSVPSFPPKEKSEDYQPFLMSEVIDEGRLRVEEETTDDSGDLE